MTFLDNDASVRERREIASRVVFKPREKSVTARVSIDGQEFENISFFQVLAQVASKIWQITREHYNSMVPM